MIPDNVIRKLRWVRVADPSAIDLALFPDFLIVGPQRTGTTWLHANLRYHPQILLSEPKEIFFFSRLKTPDHPRYQSNELAWYLALFREPLWRGAMKTALSLWKHREMYRPLVRGEATASYAALDRDVIDEITALNPDVRVIFMIRNPIDRAWSHAKKDLARNRGRKLEDVTDAELHEFFASDYQRRCAHYVENHDAWKAALQPGHLFVGHFDDIGTRPDELLLDVMTFLGVRSDRRYLAREVSEPVNPTGASKIPQQHRRFLEELLAPDLKELKDRFGLSWER